MDGAHVMIAYGTLLRKEVVRFLRIWPQTLFPPVITQTLYFLIFGKFIGAQISDINGVSYMAFIVPGLVMMTVINNSFVNVASSFFSSKFQRSVEEILVSPMPNMVIILGYIGAGVLRGMMVGILVFTVSMIFTRSTMHHLGVVALFMLLTSVLFALGGFLNGLLARKFDDIAIFPTFILMPLTYLGGIFYSINNLPPFWRACSKFNPVLYMVNGFRYGFHGFSDVNIGLSFGILVVFIVVLGWVNIILLHRGLGLKT